MFKASSDATCAAKSAATRGSLRSRRRAVCAIATWRLTSREALRRRLRAALQAAADALTDARAARDVAAAATLADVVEEDCEVEQRRVFQFLEDCAQRRAGAVACGVA